MSADTGLEDATRLIADLTSKLRELDSKVTAYRLDMAAEFTRHSEELLRSVPEDVAYRVSQAIADQLSNYPALYPPDSLSPSRSATPTRFDNVMWRGKGSPPPVLPHTSGTPFSTPKISSTPASPPPTQNQHEREQEFQGLFTPAYLPLLETTDRQSHATPTSPAGPDALPDSNNQASRDKRRPSPLRRSTDVSLESAASDCSSVKTRKSALRRSSGSSSKADSPNPRRVRFDFEGQEVLPSSSPQIYLPEPHDTRQETTTEPTPLADEPYTTSLGDIEGEEDLPGERPKKVSSTQALRALSKAPLDEGTVWTVVNPAIESEDSSSDLDKTRKQSTTISSPIAAKKESTKMIGKLLAEQRANEAAAADQAQSKAQGKAQGEAATQKVDPATIEDNEDDSDDEPVLFIAPKKKAKGFTQAHDASAAANAQTIPGKESKALPVKAKTEAGPATCVNPVGGKNVEAVHHKTTSSILPIHAKSDTASTIDSKKLTDVGVKAGTTEKYSKSAGDLAKPEISEKSTIPVDGGVVSAVSNKNINSKPIDKEVKADTHFKRKQPRALFLEDIDDDFFTFDEEDRAKTSGSDPAEAKPASTKKYLSDDEAEEIEETKVVEKTKKTDPSRPAAESASPPADTDDDDNISVSPPITIGEQKRDREAARNQVPPRYPPKPTGTRPPSTSWGSYVDDQGIKRTLTPHPVKDKALLKEVIESLEKEEPVEFFVGSVNGRSGPDSSNVKSYKATLLSPTEMSGSFAERIMWERSQGVTYDSDEESKKQEPKQPNKAGNQRGPPRRAT